MMRGDAESSVIQTRTASETIRLNLLHHLFVCQSDLCVGCIVAESSHSRRAGSCIIPKILPTHSQASDKRFQHFLVATMAKYFTALCLLTSSSLSSTTTAFSTQSSNSRKSTQLDAVNRREILSSAAGLALWTAATGAAQAANEVDFGKVQDLLGQDSTYTMSAQEYEQRSAKRPTFLKDPTEEFKQSEEKATAFKREQLKAKREFQAALDKLQTDPNDGGMLAKDLDELRYMVKNGSGLPEGITKDEVVKQVRRRKSKKFWPTEVEIAYQDLLYEILKKQSPNTDRDTDFV